MEDIIQTIGFFIIVFLCIAFMNYLDIKRKRESESKKYDDHPFIELAGDNILWIDKENDYTKIILKDTVEHIIIYDDFKKKLLEEKEK